MGRDGKTDMEEGRDEEGGRGKDECGGKGRGSMKGKEKRMGRRGEEGKTKDRWEERWRRRERRRVRGMERQIWREREGWNGCVEGCRGRG